MVFSPGIYFKMAKANPKLFLKINIIMEVKKMKKENEKEK